MRVNLESRIYFLGFGVIAFLLAGLSIADMYLPRPYDGVVLEADVPGQLIVRSVLEDSGAAVAGIEPDAQIVGIDRTMLRSTAHAAELLNAREIGALVPYLVRTEDGLREVLVELGPRRIGSPTYLYACILGFSFFFIGLFVYLRQPHLRAAQLFFVMGGLFLLFLVCRLRPASYSWVDSFVLNTGTLALLFLPAVFLHFYLIFPRPIAFRPRLGDPNYPSKRRRWVAILSLAYLFPPLVLAGVFFTARLGDRDLRLISGAPMMNWWVLALYMVLGMSSLGYQASRLEVVRERRGAAIVLAGSLLGLLPFLILAVGFPSILRSERYLFWGIVPLAVVPLSFAYAIIRFGLMDIQVILRKSLLYTGTSAVVTALYALGIALFNALTRNTSFANTPYFPILFALAIMLLFEPVRRRLQVLVDRFFFAERRGLQQAMKEMGDAFAAEVDLTPVVTDLVERLPRLLGLHFAALYLVNDDALERIEGPGELPATITIPPELRERLHEHHRLVRLEDVAPEGEVSEELEVLWQQLASAGVEVLGDLASPRRRVGLVLLSGKAGQLPLEQSELELLEGILHQAAIALETSLLLDERTKQAELERDIEIAAAVQSSLLPSRLPMASSWHVAAVCRPARHVGGDFYTELPGPSNGAGAIVYGDVAGKSVSGALVMMAAHEVLHSLAMTHRNPEELIELANQRLYQLGPRKSFVALAYLTSNPTEDALCYVLAGQPQPLRRTAEGKISELPLPDHRIPLGALRVGGHQMLEIPMNEGDLVLGYSDGVLDARSPTEEVFGTDRLIGVVATAPSNPTEAVQHVLEALDDFTRGAEPYDDVTLVAILRGDTT